MALAAPPAGLFISDGRFPTQVHRPGARETLAAAEHADTISLPTRPLPNGSSERQIRTSEMCLSRSEAVRTPSNQASDLLERGEVDWSRELGGFDSRVMTEQTSRPWDANDER